LTQSAKPARGKQNKTNDLMKEKEVVPEFEEPPKSIYRRLYDENSIRNNLSAIK
jgi:hypothetical protein